MKGLRGVEGEEGIGGEEIGEGMVRGEEEGKEGVGGFISLCPVLWSGQ